MSSEKFFCVFHREGRVTRLFAGEVFSAVCRVWTFDGVTKPNNYHWFRSMIRQAANWERVEKVAFRFGEKYSLPVRNQVVPLDS